MHTAMVMGSKSCMESYGKQLDTTYFSYKNWEPYHWLLLFQNNRAVFYSKKINTRKVLNFDDRLARKLKDLGYKWKDVRDHRRAWEIIERLEFYAQN